MYECSSVYWWIRTDCSTQEDEASIVFAGGSPCVVAVVAAVVVILASADAVTALFVVTDVVARTG